MAQHHGVLAELITDSPFREIVEIGPADAHCFDPDLDLPVGGFDKGTIHEAKGAEIV
jgi:hypothetical protein